ncbi:hypothetical protein OIU78_021296 [Salix suchowensis]|nr:hypothetical protein OIU78_021296 [Salix suchowensis]
MTSAYSFQDLDLMFLETPPFLSTLWVPRLLNISSLITPQSLVFLVSSTGPFVDENQTSLNCQNPCCIFERGWSPCFSYGAILFSSRRQNLGLVPTVHPERKKELVERDH